MLGIKLLMIFGIITPYDKVLFYLEVELFSSFIQSLTIKLLHVLYAPNFPNLISVDRSSCNKMSYRAYNIVHDAMFLMKIKSAILIWSLSLSFRNDLCCMQQLCFISWSIIDTQNGCWFYDWNVLK